jgi:hypothetical protein
MLKVFLKHFFAVSPDSSVSMFGGSQLGRTALGSILAYRNVNCLTKAGILE